MSGVVGGVARLANAGVAGAAIADIARGAGSV